MTKHKSMCISLTKYITFACITLLLLYSFNHTVFAGPSSTNFELENYTFGSGGTENSSSSNYSMFAVSGEVDMGDLSSSNFKLKPGLTLMMQANLPPAPTFINADNHYNKLKITLNTGSNPSDYKYAIAISTDNFSSETKYVQSDMTLGASLGSEDWQTYTSWGGASGAYIIGLSPGVTYTVKVSAKQGNFTETGFGPTAQATTSNPSLSFDIDVAPTDTESSPPFTVSIGSLSPSTVTTAPNKVWVDLSTNGTSGGTVYVYGTNNGLLSSSVAKTITSSSVNLTSVTEGYGAIYNSVDETSGGPIQAVSPYNGSGDNVGVIDTTKRLIFDSSNQPVTDGRASFNIKAKASAVTEAATDYTDSLTVIATAGF